MSSRFTINPGGQAPRAGGNSPGCLVFFFGIFLLFGLVFLVVFGTTFYREVQSDPNASKVQFLFLLIPLIFVAVGLGGVVWGIRNWGKSPEEMAAAPVDERRGSVSGDALQALPDAKTESGTFLAKRLQRSVKPGCELGGLLFFALFWNGIVSVFLWHVVQEWQGGERPIFLTVFLIPFVLVGLFVVYWLIHQALVFAGVKETVVEIEHEPVCPGESVQLRIAQQGPVSLYSLVATLKCTEEISYTRGTDTYHESHTLLERELLRLPATRVASGSTMDQTVMVEIPEDAMHSFEAKNNKVVWTLTVQGEVEKWPDFEHAFTFRVVPEEARREIQ